MEKARYGRVTVRVAARGDEGVSPLPPAALHMHNVAMWILALFLIMVVISILVAYWQLILTGLVIWGVVVWTRRVAADAKPNYPRIPVQTRPVAKPVQTRPVSKPVRTRPELRSKPARELPAPDYLPRWTANRRLDAGREHVQWQREFDSTLR